MENKALQEFYNRVIEKPLKIYEIFCDFYGEENVDIQGLIDHDNLERFTNNYFGQTYSWDRCPLITDYTYITEHPYILVHYPKVRITNELDKYVDITHLYAKITINYNGLYESTTFCRSEYPVSHIMNNYIHSHVRYLNSAYPEKFQNPCFGQGSINATIASLVLNFNEALWNLFCLELDNFTKVESLKGVPYIKMSVLTNNEVRKELFVENYFVYNDAVFATNVQIMMRQFIVDFIVQKKLKFNYFNESFGFAMSYLEYLLLVSNSFIEWYNAKILEGKDYSLENVLDEYIIENNCLYKLKLESYDTTNLQGMSLFKFKDKIVTLNILKEDDNDYSQNTVRLLNIDLANKLYHVILETLNYRYGNKDFRTDKIIKFL